MILDKNYRDIFDTQLTLSINLLDKLDDQSSVVFEHLLRSWRCICRKEDLLDELTKALINWASNTAISQILSSKLTDNKYPILNDIVGVITK